MPLVRSKTSTGALPCRRSKEAGPSPFSRRHSIRRVTLLHLALLVLVVLAVFGNCLGNGFVWDDNTYVVTNRIYREGDIRSILTSPANGVEYLPVRDLSHVADFLLWGDSARGFHFASVAVYAGAVVAVYFFTLELFLLVFPAGDRRRLSHAAGAAALLFALNPLHSEVVAWITGRNTLLCGLFFFLSAALYLRFLRRDRGGWLFHAGALVLFILALFSKAPAIVLPPIILFLSHWSRRGSRLFRVVATLPFWGVAGSAFFLFRRIALRAGVIPPVSADPTQGDLLGKLAVAVQIPFFYLGKLLLPLDLAAEYAVAFSRDPAGMAALLGAGGLLLILAVSWLSRRGHPPLALSVGFFLISLLPVLNLFRTYPTVADRYAFLPSYGFCLLLASFLLLLPRRFTGIFCLGGLLLALFWGTVAVRANRAWQSDETVWERAVTLQPASAMAHYQLGRVYYRTGRLEGAMAQFARAQELDPRHPYHDFFRGYLCLLDGNYGCATELFEGNIAANGDFIDPLYHMGYAMEKLGRGREAAEYYHRVTAARERDVSGFRQLAKERLRVLRRAGY